jgi:predicted deacylase
MALQKLPHILKPEEIKGTMIIVHMANVRAFFGRSVFYNPADGKNLNRSFPGNKNGTITECLAFTLSNEIISRCDFLVDIHAGDASEDLHPYVGYYEYGSQTSKAKQMAEALGFPWVIISGNTPKTDQPTVYCSAQSVSRDIPTVAIEYGKLGQVKTEEAEFINGRLINMMRSIGILNGSALKSNPPLVIKKRISITSDHTGIFYTDFKSAEPVTKGLKLGVITDLFGNVLQEVVSPVDGFIIYLSVTPPINKEETLFSIAVTE